MKGFDPVLFDLDGTVVDTVELIRASFRHAVVSVLGRDLPDEVIMAGVGTPLYDQMQILSPGHAQELTDAYREFNHRLHHALIREYAGVEAALGRLKAAQRRLAVVTSKGRLATDLALESFPYLERLTDVIVTADDSAAHKPDPAPLRLALERLGATPERAIYVGDAPVDILAGKAAGMATAAVLWGIFSRERLLAVEPDFALTDPEQLVALCLEGSP